MSEHRLGRAFRDGIVAATIAGLGSALITRLLMRVVEVLTNGTPHFDVVASTGIAIVYVVFLLPACVALAYGRGRWPWIVFSAGAAILLFEAVAIGLEETTDTRDMTGLRWAALVIVLAAMAATYGAQMLLAVRLARRHAPGTFARSVA